jgi:rod shape-determining protein MreC
MFDPNLPESIRPAQALNLDGHDMPAFIRRHQSFLTLLLAVTLQILLLSLQIIRPNHVRLIRYWAVEAFDPLERGLEGMMNIASTAYRTYGHLWSAEQENQELHNQLVAAQAQIQRLSEQAGETERLRTLLDFKKQSAFQTVGAEVIFSSPAASPGENSNAVFIDKGSDSGLSTDLAVITPEGVVGKILAIYPHSAQVLLITDRSSGVGVTLAQSRVQGILKGDSTFCDIHFVMNEETVNPGEAVVTSGLDQVYPKGLPVGSVVNVGDGGIYKSINVKPSVDLNRLEMVLVILKPTAAEPQALNLPLRQQ